MEASSVSERMAFAMGRAMGVGKHRPRRYIDITDGMLVRRPPAVGDGFVLTGFKEEEWAENIK